MNATEDTERPVSAMSRYSVDAVIAREAERHMELEAARHRDRVMFERSRRREHQLRKDSECVLESNTILT